jgi:hypothetical protein
MVHRAGIPTVVVAFVQVPVAADKKNRETVLQGVGPLHSVDPWQIHPYVLHCYELIS